MMSFCKPTTATAIAAILVLAAVPMAHAGGSIFAGVTFPTGDFNDAAKNGWTGGAYYTANLAPLVELGGLVAYNDFSFGTTDIPGLDELFGNGFDAWEVEALGQVNVLFLKGFLGLGLANYSGIDENGNDSRQTDFAWQVGVSANLMMLEARLGYHQIKADNSTPNWLALTVGLTF